MVSEAVQMNRLANGETGSNTRKQSEQICCQGFSGGRHGNLGSGGTSATICYSDDRREGKASRIPSRNITENLDSNMQSDVVIKKARKQREMTFQDMYDNQDTIYDDDDDEDSDWEPKEGQIEWFCTNCTMVNRDDIEHCDICGEHKKSGILQHGFFAPSHSQIAGLPEFESEIMQTIKEPCSQSSASNKSTAVGFDERMLLHSEVALKPTPHPERPDRLRAIAASLATAGIFPGRCFPISAREITPEELQMVHTLDHIEAVELTSHIFSSYFTSDTYANEHSARAARLAAGLCADLASAIYSERVKNGFALVRPPGHHAGVRHSMGFCLHNNAAVAALAAQVAGAKKVLIVDWDVHHGNGTQEIFQQNKSVLYISLHRHEGGDFYPGTGAADEIGTLGAEGYCVNIPWSRGGVGDNDYVFAFQQIVLPIASEFAPDFTIISAGFDAARGDPLGCCDVTPDGYAQMTHMLNDLSGGKLLVILEGGYNLRSISSSATAVIKVLLGESPGLDFNENIPSKSGLRTVLEVMEIQMKFWPILGSNFAKLQSQWRMLSIQNKTNAKIKDFRARLEKGKSFARAKGTEATIERYLRSNEHTMGMEEMFRAGHSRGRNKALRVAAGDGIELPRLKPLFLASTCKPKLRVYRNWFPFSKEEYLNSIEYDRRGYGDPKPWVAPTLDSKTTFEERYRGRSSYVFTSETKILKTEERYRLMGVPKPRSIRYQRTGRRDPIPHYKAAADPFEFVQH